ncbi:MAG: hypothetical protein F6K32_03030 [Desertifilum sp. SIO1I2]|nr:hypothetical protein [Desertifilum sp. SIO1I2]
MSLRADTDFFMGLKYSVFSPNQPIRVSLRGDPVGHWLHIVGESDRLLPLLLLLEAA